MASDSVVRRFCTPEEPDQEFTKYEIVKVVTAEVDLDRWLKRRRGARSESLGT
jgi:hypothetical protein